MMHDMLAGMDIPNPQDMVAHVFCNTTPAHRYQPESRGAEAHAHALGVAVGEDQESFAEPGAQRRIVVGANLTACQPFT